MKIDIETFFDKMLKSLKNLIQKELLDLGSAKIQTTIWLKFRQEKILIEKAFNSKTTEVYKGSNFDEIFENLFAFMKTQIENPAFEKSGFTLNRVLHLNIDFHKLNLTRGNSYIPLPSWIPKKKAIINPKNKNDEECFKWAVTAALNYKQIGKTILKE